MQEEPEPRTYLPSKLLNVHWSAFAGTDEKLRHTKLLGRRKIGRQYDQLSGRTASYSGYAFGPKVTVLKIGSVA